MDEIGQQFEQIQTTWEGVYETLKANPAAAAPHLANATPDQVAEVIETIGYWLKRIRAPQGYAPAFHVAKGLASTALPGATNALQALRRGEYAHLNAFLVALNQLLSALHSMLVFSDKQRTRDAVAELGGKLAEALALLDRAQRELERKTNGLNAADESLQIVQRAEAAVAAAESATQAALGEIESRLESATEHLAKIETAVTEAKELRESFSSLLASNQQLASKLATQAQELATLNDGSRKQAELIAALLPSGASAGLASAFGSRVGQLERTKWIWAVVFLVSILSLCYLGYRVLGIPHGTPEEFWRDLLHRLPLAAPLVWLGWFSAIQYGNTLRVQEDYAFKEATSKAFAGYRDHMEHMASVSLAEANSAMTLLAGHTIEILSREPLRIFGKTELDASPSHSVLNALALRGRKTAGTPAE